MKIAMLGQKGFPGASGGVEQHVDVLSRLLVKRGHEVIGYSRRSYCGKDAGSMRIDGVQRIVRPSIATKHLDAISHTLVSTIDVMLRRADVVHYHAIGPAALAPLARLVGLPVVVTVHGLDWQRAKWGRVARRCLRLGERIAARSATQLIVVSPLLKEHFDRRHSVKSEFIPNGVMPITYRNPDHMAEWDLNPGQYVLAVARLVPEKGLHYLIEAYKGLDTDMPLVIAGGGGLDSEYERRLRRTQDPRVRFLGDTDRDTLSELYSHAALFVLPSDLEGMSIALLEAMSMGTPVLASDIPENLWLVSEAGFSFAAGDVADLRSHLDRLLRDKTHRRQHVVAGRKKASQFRWTNIVERLESVYAYCAGQADAIPNLPLDVPADAPSAIEYASQGSSDGPWR